jgi:single-stranded-DNA-specific exonuclease
MRWTIIPEPDSDNISHLKEALQVPQIIAKLLVQRGVSNFQEAKRFFRPSLAELHDPFLMKDMDVAVARINKAIDINERVLVFGDYDVDGTTAVALVSSFLKTLTHEVVTYIPDRYKEGYGVSYAGIDFAADNDFSLIIALDCGIKSIEHVNYASSKNIDFIICDHHNPGEELPNAIAVLDPKRTDCDYPYKELCGCGVGFKLIQALGTERGITIEDFIPYLDLVATAIAADLVPMTGENRVLAKFGMEVINSNPRPGIKALIEQVKKKTLTITDVVFVVAPRINAAGRIQHGDFAVRLLTQFTIEKARKVAEEIELFNKERRELDQNITEEALKMVLKNNEVAKSATVVYSPNWHKGVIGIVASRLIENHYKPTIVFTKSGDVIAASARSVPGFDLYKAIENCSEHLIQFGGHKFAAGMTCLPEKYEDFKLAFEQEVEKTILPEQKSPEIEIDLEINFDEITPKLIRILNQFEPFGPGNMHPVFYSKNIKDTGYAKILGSNDAHLKMYVSQSNSEKYNVIAFGQGDKLQIVQNQNPFEMAYVLEENEWNGKVSTQLQARAIR